MSIYEVDKNKLISALAEDLKKNNFPMPEWAFFTKTGRHRERAPDSENWWHIRAASILYQLHKRGPTGTERFRVYYGGKRNRGTKPNKFFKSSGKIIRTILQNLESLGFVEKCPKGRKLTKEGANYLNKFASKLKGGKVEGK